MRDVYENGEFVGTEAENANEEITQAIIDLPNFADEEIPWSRTDDLDGDIRIQLASGEKLINFEERYEEAEAALTQAISELSKYQRDEIRKKFTKAGWEFEYND